MEEPKYIKLVSQTRPLGVTGLALSDFNPVTNFKVILPSVLVAGLGMQHYTKKYALYFSKFNRTFSTGVNFLLAMYFFKNLSIRAGIDVSL